MGGNYNKRWTKEDLQFLKDNYLEMSNKELASYLKRTVDSIRAMKTKQGFTRKNNYWLPWTDEENQYLADNYKDMTDKELSEKLKRSQGAIASQRHKLGLSKFTKNSSGIYALYKGDDLMAIGTIDEIAEETGVDRESVKHYGTPAYRRRTSEANGRRLVDA